MSLTIVQWNICNRARPERVAAYLADLFTTHSVICVLEEVTSRAFSQLVERLQPSTMWHTLAARPPGNFEGRNRGLGIAILSDLSLTRDPMLIWRSLFPERTVDAEFCFDGTSVRVVGFHSLTGVGYRKAKSSNFATIADHLAENPSIDFACFDANEPKVDSLDPAKRVFYDNRDGGKKASLLLGPDKVHQLQDALITYRMATGHHVDANPLAISHRTGGNDRRYDYILHAYGWRPERVVYDYDGALEATSDHAAVIGTFAPTPRAPLAGTVY